MKKTLLSVILSVVVITTGLFAQNQILTVGHGAMHNQTILALSNDRQTSMQFLLNKVELLEMATNYGQAFIPYSDKAPLMLEAGAPELFYLTSSFIIPDQGSADLEISYGAFTDYENIEIAPSKGNLSRNINPATVPFVKGEVYSVDAFFPGTLASLREPFIMRDVRGQSLDVYPVQYNPVTKILRVYSEITVNVVYNTNKGINEFTTQKRNKTIDPAFNQMYDNMFINNASVSKNYPTGETGELLIISHPAFADAMKPYVDWKHTIGRKTTLVTTAETGTSGANIKSYILNYYNNPDNNLAYVLLVGDVAQIPTLGTSSVPSDIEYGLLTGNDNYLEILLGRMSSENPTHVQTQVERSIWYERDITTTDTWLNTSVGIAVREPGNGHDGGEDDYQHMNNIRTRLLDYGYDPVYQEYFNNAPGIPNSSNAQITSRFNAGAGMTNYCNHGMETAWTPTGGAYYSNTQVNALQNAGKLPFIFSVACLNGKFNYTQPCFAEAWMRATQNNQPTGAVATLMATISLSWLPPMTAQDEFVDLCLGIRHTAGGFNYGIDNNTLRTIAGVMLNATQRMVQRHGSSGVNDYKSWTVFGDPTLQFRTKTPEEMNITHLPIIPLGSETFTVACDANGALATLSYVNDDNEVVILGSAAVVEGIAEITFAPVTTTTDVTLAVIGFNKVTYLSEPISVGVLELNAPKNLSFITELANHVILNWEAPEGKGLTVAGYNVYRNEQLITFEPIKEELTYTDIVEANGEYKYEVTALYNASGSLESEPCAFVTVTIDGMCVPFPNDIMAIEDEDNHIVVSWSAPEYAGTELAGYNVYRGAELLNTEILAATELSFIDTTNLETGINYCYQVEVVYNDCEAPLKSNEACHTLSIHEIAATFQIYPNPAHNEVTISGGNVTPTAVHLYNIFGQTLYETAQCTSNMRISVSTLPAGIYFIRIDTEQGNVTQKIVVK